jgi:hypothetical protein
MESDIMVEEKQKNKTRIMSTKSWRTFLIMLAALLTFAGPTYMVYILINVLDLNYAVSMVSGFALFIVGLALIWYLIRQKALS